MGTDLIAIGNHKINFRSRRFKEIADEIKFKLNNIIFTNADFLHDFALNWNKDRPHTLEEIETKKEWTYEDENQLYSFHDDIYIKFYGPHDLSLNFDQYQLSINNPNYRYRQWFELKDKDGIDAIEHRNEWRKYMRQIVKAFGGDRVIYLADNSHPLDKYNYLECSFEEVEAALKKDFGEAKMTFKEVTLDYNHSYFTDTFNDLK